LTKTLLGDVHACDVKGSHQVSILDLMDLSSEVAGQALIDIASDNF
jgi:hypothetical protein